MATRPTREQNSQIGLAGLSAAGKVSRIFPLSSASSLISTPQGNQHPHRDECYECPDGDDSAASGRWRGCGIPATKQFYAHAVAAVGIKRRCSSFGLNDLRSRV